MIKVQTLLLWLLVVSGVVACALFSQWALLLLPVLGVMVSALTTQIYGALLLILLPVSLSAYFTSDVSQYLVHASRFGCVIAAVVVFARLGWPRRISVGAMMFLISFVVIVAITTPFVSAYVGISLLKLLYWCVFMLLIFSIANLSFGVDWLAVSVVCFVAVASAFVYLVNPEVGYAFTHDGAVRDGLFSGVMNHPQLLACFLAVSLPLMWYCALTASGLVSLAAYILMGVSIVVIASTSSRTGAATAVVALMISSWGFGFKSMDFQVRRSARLLIAVMVVLVLIVLIFKWELLLMYVVKEAGSVEVAFSGRDKIIGDSWSAFIDSPVFGNGFQVPSSRTEHGLDLFGVDGSTAIEKSFFITMILEECGLVGFLLFVLAMICMMLHALRLRAYVFVATMAAFATANLGEAVLFSPSALGGLCWVLCMSVYAVRVR